MSGITVTRSTTILVTGDRGTTHTVVWHDELGRWGCTTHGRALTECVPTRERPACTCGSGCSVPASPPTLTPPAARWPSG